MNQNRYADAAADFDLLWRMAICVRPALPGDGFGSIGDIVAASELDSDSRGGRRSVDVVAAIDLDQSGVVFVLRRHLSKQGRLSISIVRAFIALVRDEFARFFRRSGEWLERVERLSAGPDQLRSVNDRLAWNNEFSISRPADLKALSEAIFAKSTG